MQISTANLLIASQPQAPQPAQQSPGQAAFAAQVEKTAKSLEQGFEPMAFKPAPAPAEAAKPSAAAQPAKAYGQAQRLGGTLDISV
jgi:hypothetical protein